MSTRFLRKYYAELVHQIRSSLYTIIDKRPSWLTEDFLKTVFKNGKISDVKISQVVPKTQRFCGDIFRVRLGKKSVIVKTLPQNNVIKLVNYIRMFEKEELMYRVMNDIELMLGERIAPKRIPYPDLFVIEDLALLGYQTLAEKEQLRLNICNIAVAALAKLHASSISLIPLYSNFDEEHFFHDGSPYAGTPVIEALAEVVKTWPEISQFSERLLEYSKIAFHKATEEVQSFKELLVLNHGDYHTGNIMFNQKNLVLMIDFQFPRINSPAMDIIYFMTTSARADVRQHHKKEVLNSYVQSFNRTAEKIGLSQKISLPYIEQEIHSFRNYSFFIAAMKVALVLSECSEDVRRKYLDKRKIIELQRSKLFRDTMPVIIKEAAEIGVF